MQPAAASKIDWAERKAEFVRTGLAQEKLSGITELVRCIAEQVDADGCILWQTVPGTILDREKADGRLFVAAEWFLDGTVWHSHEQGLNTVTGRAILHNTPAYVPDFEDCELINPQDQFFTETGIQAFYTLPITYLRESAGAVTVYKKSKNSFAKAELEFIADRGCLVPAIYQTILDKVNRRLIEEVNAILQVSELTAPGKALPEQLVKATLQSICTVVSDTFCSEETSVFLEDWLRAPAECRLQATTWEDFGKTGPYKKVDLRIESVPVGFSPWVLAYGRSLQIFDLVSWPQDKKRIRKRYAGIDWRDPVGAAKLVSKKRGTPEDRLPPLSYMASPIKMDNRVLGLIRCCAARQAPYYYSESENELLERVAAQISHFWYAWVSRKAHQQQIDSLEALVRSMSEMNHYTLTELGKEHPDETQIFAKALKVASAAIPGTDLMDVMMAKEDRTALEFRAFYGSLWTHGTREGVDRRQLRSLRVSEPPRSVGARVFLRGEVELIPDVSDEPLYSPTFSEVKRIIVAPISSENETYGVVRFRGTGETPFLSNAKLIGELLGRQLGLYHRLAIMVGEIKKAQSEFQEGIERQQKVSADLAHQFKTPSNLAYLRLQSALQCTLGDEAQEYLMACRSHLSRARQLSWSVRLFVDLHTKGRIEVRPKPIQNWVLDDLVKEAVSDMGLAVDPEREIRFRIDKQVGQAPAGRKLRVDRDLLEPALFNILDNAGKYSFRNTTIRVSSGFTKKKDHRHITVQNVGFRIDNDDLPKVVERGWRSEDAEAVTDEGSGIGLWIVDHIMRAHGGRFLISSEKGGVTTARLLFPVD